MASKKGKEAEFFDPDKIATEFPKFKGKDTILFCIHCLKLNPGARLPEVQEEWKQVRTVDKEIMGRGFSVAKQALGLSPSTSSTKTKRAVSDPEVNKKIRMARTFFPELGDVLPQIRKLEKIQRSMDEVRKAVDEVPADKRNVLFALFPILKGLAGKVGNSESVPF